jgi:hypothetical protein
VPGPQGPVGPAGAPQTPSSTTPLVESGSGAVGTSLNYARADHVHPAAAGGTSVTISDTPPGSPTVGNLWWESDTGNLYIFYNDGNSSQWVLAAASVPFGAVLYSAQTLTDPQKTQAQQNIGVSQRSYLAGLTLSTPGSSGSFTVQPGVATDSTNAAMMTLAAAMTKTQTTWAVGNGGALDTGSISVGQWCHVYLMRRPDTGVVDVAFSLSAVAPTTGGNIPAAYTQFRRIGSMKVGAGGFWAAFTQVGDEFLWTTAVQDVNGTAVTTVLSQTPQLSVPTGVKVSALMRVGVNHASGTTALLMCSPDETPTLPIGLNITVQNYVASGSSFCAIPPIRTNTAGQLSVVAQQPSGTGYFIFTYGWIDRRGRDA